MKKYAAKGNYLEAKQYLENICKKVQFYSNYEMLLYYLGYLELALDNLDNAKEYFSQLDMNNINYGNVRFIASAIFLIGMIYLYEENTFELNKIINTINDKKPKILSLSKNNSGRDTILNIILDLNYGDKLKGIDNLSACVFNNLPFVQRYISKNNE